MWIRKNKQKTSWRLLIMLLSVEDKIITSTQRSLSSGPKVAVVERYAIKACPRPRPRPTI